MLIVQITTYKLGPLKTNCYLIKDEKTNKIAIIDPGGISKDLDDYIKKIGKANFFYILLTHGHFDHIRKAQRYKELTASKIVISKKESEFTSNPELNLSYKFGQQEIKPFSADIFVKDGDIINLGNLKIKVFETPGHTVGSVCYLVNDCIFSGDTLMKDSIGRTDLATGTYEDMLKSIIKLNSIKDDYKIYPGHGEFTTLDYEKNNNIYFRKAINDTIYKKS